MRVLLVEDDALLGAAVQAGLEQSDYTVDWLRDGAQAASALRTAEPDLLILDIGLPGRNGLGILAELRARGSNLPVLLLTARDTVSDRIAGLDSGADDYLVKPFDLGELTARLRAIARRRGGRAEAVIRHGDLVLDPASRAVTMAGESVSLSAKATMILEALLERPGIPVSRERLELTLYGWNEGVDSNTIEVHVHHLRKNWVKTSSVRCAAWAT